MSEILYEKRENVATITVNRPERRNTITAQAANLLRGSLYRADHDQEIRVIVLTGTGDSVFCAGGDLGREAADAGVIARYDANREMVELFKDIRLLRKPIIARINGHALGLGFSLLLACDLALAADDVRFGCPELKVGMFPMFTLIHLSRHIGPKKALEMLLTTQQITAQEAERLGLINAAVGREELDLKTMEFIARLAEFSPSAIRLGREAFYGASEMGFSEALEYLLSQMTLTLQTEDAKEGAAAFLQKRPPEWKGR